MSEGTRIRAVMIIMDKAKPVIFILLILLATSCRGGVREADTGEATNGETGDESGTITLSGPAGVSVEWPKDIPFASGMVLQSVTLNEVGGFDAVFQAEGSMDRIPVFYQHALAEWESREPIERRALVESAMLSWYRDDETFDLVVVPVEGGAELSVTAQYNWRTPPGVLPEGWPSYIPVMPDMVLEYGYNGGGGERTICMSGEVSFEGVADYYAGVLSDWVRHGMGVTPETGHQFMMVNFERGTERIVLSGREVGEIHVILLSWVRPD